MKHLINYVFVWPQGVVPPDPELPTDYVPKGRMEAYEFRFAAEAPTAGQAINFEARQWIITQISTYQSECPGRTDAFHIAICSQDGIPPERQDWAKSAPILCIPALPSGEIANTEGVSHFALVWEENHISVEFDDWDLMTVQRFTPICDRIPGGYDTVAICWCVSEQAAVAV